MFPEFMFRGDSRIDMFYLLVWKTLSLSRTSFNRESIGRQTALKSSQESCDGNGGFCLQSLKPEGYVQTRGWSHCTF